MERYNIYLFHVRSGSCKCSLHLIVPFGAVFKILSCLIEGFYQSGSRANLAGPSLLPPKFCCIGIHFPVFALLTFNSPPLDLYTMNKITSILLLLAAVLVSAAMANEEDKRPGGFYLRGEEEQDLIREVRAVCMHAWLDCMFRYKEYIILTNYLLSRLSLLLRCWRKMKSFGRVNWHLHRIACPCRRKLDGLDSTRRHNQYGWFCGNHGDWIYKSGHGGVVCCLERTTSGEYLSPRRNQGRFSCH